MCFSYDYKRVLEGSTYILNILRDGDLVNYTSVSDHLAPTTSMHPMLDLNSCPQGRFSKRVLSGAISAATHFAWAEVKKGGKGEQTKEQKERR